MMCGTELHFRPLALFVAMLLSAFSAACGGGEPVQSADADDHADETDVVHLDSAGIAIAGITLVPAEPSFTFALPVTGTVTFDANHVSKVGSRLDGRVVRLSADIGTNVVAGQELAIIQSPEIGQLRVDEHNALALVAIARENFERERRLETLGISSRSEALAAEADLRRSEATLNGARERLRALGAEEGEGGEYVLRAPGNGVVVARHAALGEVTKPADPLFTLANLDQLWVEFNIYERDIAHMKPGQVVEISTAAHPGRIFRGEITYVGEVLDAVRRTVEARVVIRNSERALKPGMFVSANVLVERAGNAMVAIPEKSVQQVGGRTVVFVPGDEPGEFRMLPIETGDRVADGRIVVRAGLNAGDRVVGRGAFALRSELAKTAIREAGHGH